ncbi:hypothetical protein [Acinetobacter sp. BIGb0102]|uniref:hypothetical protein n=1 Tax=Acinetobacter sp. BIGb0102 TaxID=2485131 RepID=UPI000F4D5B42|nr:hypothetical protein [Acinetobacter sp. BIGb0102]
MLKKLLVVALGTSLFYCAYVIATRSRPVHASEETTKTERLVQEAENSIANAQDALRLSDSDTTKTSTKQSSDDNNL